MTAVQELEWTFLTPMVNEIKPVQTFLKQSFFGRSQVMPTELLEIGYLRGDRSIAPFVTKDAEAIMVEGLTSDALTLRPPTIKIKKPFIPTPLFFKPDFGEVLYLTAGQSQVSAIQEHIARDSQRMVDLVRNSEEYLASMALTGTVAYTNEQDGVAFTVTYAKSAENTVTLSGADLWTASTSDPAIDVLRARRRQADAVGLQPTDAVMGLEAAEAFLQNAQVRQDLDNRRLESGGTISIASQFNDQGVIFLGNYAGIRWWEYSRQLNVPGLGLVDLIRPKFVEFLSTSPAADMVTYYGAIRDMEAMMGGMLASERFSKSWLVKDPSAMVQLIESHPLPVLRRPDSVYSLQVVA